MKVASKLILLFNDSDGYAAALYDALQPNPNPNFALQKSESSFELPLDRYGIKDQKACGRIAHFVDDRGQFEISVLLMQYYEPPTLAPAINELLGSITSESSSSSVTLVLPFLVPASNLKCGDKSLSAHGNKISPYGVQIGPETDFTRAIVKRAQKPPSSLQIHYEPLACSLQFIRVLGFSTAILIAQRGQHSSIKALNEELEVLNEIGEMVANASSLCFVRDQIKLNPSKTSKAANEPWRALYG